MKNINVLVWVGTSQRFSYIYVCSVAVWSALGLLISMQTHTPNADTRPIVFLDAKNASLYHQHLKTHRQSCSHLGLPEAVLD
jgi:hypothetical protein